MTAQAQVEPTQRVEAQKAALEARVEVLAAQVRTLEARASGASASSIAELEGEGLKVRDNVRVVIMKLRRKEE